MLTAAFWTAAAERALKTFAQALVAFIGTDAAGILDVNWAQAASVAGLAAILSILTSIAGGSTGPSWGAEQLKTNPQRKIID